VFLQLGHLVHRRRRRVLVAWALFAIVGIALAGPAVDHLRPPPPVEPGTEAAAALAAEEATGVGGNAVTAVVPGAPADAGTAATLSRLHVDLVGLTGVTFVVDATTAGTTFTAPDGRSSAVLVLLSPQLSEGDARDTAERVADRIHELPGATAGGDVLARTEVARVATRDAAAGERVSTPLTLLAMAVIFAGLVAALVPLSVAGAAVLCALTILLVVAQFTGVSSFAVNIVSLLGLGLGIDYGLLAVHRFRERRAAGDEVGDAVATTVATAGRTITFSALIVAVSMCGLLLITTDDMRSLAIGGVAVTLCAALAAVTLLPALLSVLARRIRPSRRASAGSPTGDHGPFAALAGMVHAHPALLGSVALGVLVVLSLPLLHLRTQLADERFLPTGDEVRTVQETMRQDFPMLATSATVVVADVDATSPTLATYRSRVAGLAGVSAVTVQPNPFGRSRPAVLRVDTAGGGTGGGQDDTAEAVVQELRAEPAPFPVLVGGPAAQLVDSTASLRARLPLAIGFVLLASLVLLWLFTGSVVLPVKALVMNLLSISATFGVVVWAFQDGHLSGLLHFSPIGALELTAPVMIFMFAFGLSMDYEVFLLGRIKEEFDRTGDNDLAVRVGLQRVGRLVTSAALLIVLVLGAAAVTGSMLANQTFAFGLAVAVIIDATIVRSLLVPAAMTLMGGANWWSPAALRRLHARIGISESEPAVAVPGGIGIDLTAHGPEADSLDQENDPEHDDEDDDAVATAPVPT
jgi:RND superfamily putative drug exporter